MSRNDFLFIVRSFLIWRTGILIVAFFAVKFIPLFSNNFLGGGYSNYINDPVFWGHLNFDGEHYLALIQFGYQPLTYFFFPLYPLLVKILAFVNTQQVYALTGIIVSNVSFFIALIGVFKLVKLDYKESIAKLTVILFLFFPTSFYFGIFYTESLFLLFIVWSFYFVRKQKFLFSPIFAALASATRIVGVVLFPSLILEMFIQKKKNYLFILISPIGVAAYMCYLWMKTGDPLIFLHQISIYGAQRSSSFILLPQVIYRYLFKILPSLNYLYFPSVFTTYLEFVIGLLFLILIIYGLFKLRVSYSVFAVLTYIIPTMVGSFSSLPRYVLVIFPIFILSAIYLNRTPKIYTYIIFSVMLILTAITTAMFWRGYWIS